MYVSISPFCIETSSYSPVLKSYVLYVVSASSDPNNEPLTYSWTAPTGITLSNSTAPSRTFTSPRVDAQTDYTFSLTVNDGTADSTSDSVKVTVSNNINEAPTANAGVDQEVNEDITVIL